MTYVPNKFPLKKRLANIVYSAILIIYGGYGIYVNDLFLPSKHGGIHLRDVPAILMYAAFICGSLVMMSLVIDHYDERNNEKMYQEFSEIFKWLGVMFLVFSVVWHIVELFT